MANTLNKVISIAEAEVGYLEKKSNSNLDGKTSNAGSNNYTKYWKDLCPGMNGQAWCNCFVNWCFVQAYGGTAAKKLLCTDGGWSYYTPTSASYFKSKGQWYTKNPQAGDIIYFKNSTRIHHVGLVYKVSGSTVYTIEGNTSNGTAVVANGGGVCKKSYSIYNGSIAGYGRPKYDKEYTATTVTYKVGDSAENGVWYLYKNGAKCSDTTVAQNKNGWWYCKDGKVDFTFTGVASNVNGTWYCEKGQVTFKYNGKVSYNGKTYNVVNSKATIVNSTNKIDDAPYMEKSYGRTWTTTSKLNMRKGPNKDIITVLPNGAKVQCYGYYSKDSKGGIWLLVKYNNQEGYVSKTYVK